MSNRSNNFLKEFKNGLANPEVAADEPTELEFSTAFIFAEDKDLRLKYYFLLLQALVPFSLSLI